MCWAKFFAPQNAQLAPPMTVDALIAPAPEDCGPFGLSCVSSASALPLAQASSEPPPTLRPGEAGRVRARRRKAGFNLILWRAADWLAMRRARWRPRRPDQRAGLDLGAGGPQLGARIGRRRRRRRRSQTVKLNKRFALRHNWIDCSPTVRFRSARRGSVARMRRNSAPVRQRELAAAARLQLWGRCKLG